MEIKLTPKQEIMCLIESDMRTRKLIIGLEDAGLGAGDYYTNLYIVIFNKMGFTCLPDELMEWYDLKMDDLMDGVDAIFFMQRLHDLSLKMYDELTFKRHTIQ